MNVLVAASRADHPHHPLAQRWLASAMVTCRSGAPLRLMPMVVASFLRLVTSARIFVNPTPTQHAVAFIDALLAAPGVQMPGLGQEWSALRSLCLARQLSGNDLPDAWLAAAVVQQGEHLVTFDRDFRRLLAAAQVTVLSVQRATR